MKVLFRWVMVIALMLVALGTLAVFGLLNWVAEQGAVRLLVDGQTIDLTVPSGWSLAGLLSVVALTLLILVFLVPTLVVLAVLLGLLGTLLGGFFALLPLLLVIGLIVWVIRRNQAR